MKKLFAIFILVCLFSVGLNAQTSNTFNAREFAGGTVGAKVTAAQAQCNTATIVPCIIIIDPILAAFPEGTMPTKCAQCSWLDYRAGTPPSPSAPKNQIFVFEGDSITAGLGLSAGQDYPSQAMLQSFFAGNGTKYNFAVSGSQIGDVTSRYAANVKPLCQQANSIRKTYLFLLVGLNDSDQGGANANTIFNAIQSYWTTAKADGCTVIAITPYHTTVQTAAQVAITEALDSLIVTNAGSWDYLVDLDWVVKNSANPNAFQGDNTHPSANGAIRIAKLVNATMWTGGSFGTVTQSNNLAVGLGDTVCVGCQNPFKTFQVNFPSSNLANPTNEGQSMDYNSDTTVGNWACHLFGSAAVSTTLPSARICAENTSGGSYVHIQTSNNYATGITNDGLNVDKTGQVGVGIYPTKPLDVNGAARVLGTATVNAVNADGAHPSNAVTAGGVNTANGVGVLATVVAGNSVTPIIYLDSSNNTQVGTGGNATYINAFAMSVTSVSAGQFPYTPGLGGIFQLADNASRSFVLPSAGQVGSLFIIKDSAGTAATHNIAITVASAGTIDGVSTLTINTNNGVARVYYSATGVYKTW